MTLVGAFSTYSPSTYTLAAGGVANTGMATVLELNMAPHPEPRLTMTTESARPSRQRRARSQQARSEEGALVAGAALDAGPRGCRLRQHSAVTAAAPDHAAHNVTIHFSTV